MRIRLWLLAAVGVVLGACSFTATLAPPRVAPEVGAGAAEWMSVPQYGGELA